MSDSELQAYNVLEYIISSLAILLNGLLLLAMYKERKKIFVSRISWLVANLALADFLTGVFVIFFVQPITSIDFTEHNRFVQKLEVPLPWTAMLVSFLTLFLMAAERLVVVVLPMTWSAILTTQRTIIGIIITWIISIVCAVFIHYDHFKALFSILIIIEISTLFFIATHVYILRLLRKREKEKNVSNLESSQSNPWIPPEPSNQVTTTAHRKVTAVVSTLLVVLILTCIPHFICLQIFFIYHVFGVRLDLDNTKYDLALEYTEAFAYMNFVVNPIIYAWRLRMYRKALCGLVKCILGGRE